MRLVMPALFIRLPAKMKNGTASSGKLSMPLIIRWTTANGGVLPVSRMYTSAEPAMAIATGTPVVIMPMNVPSSAGVMTQCPSASPRRSSRDLVRRFGPLEQPVPAAPVEHGDLQGAQRRAREAEHAHAVDEVHRQVDDRHLVVDHLFHHLP